MIETGDPWCGVQWVRIMCDFSAEAVWNIEGACCDLADLPVSEALAARLAEWQLVYDRTAPTFDPPGDEWDPAKFSADGLELARSVKRELPDWTVIYFDEFRARQAALDAPRNDFEYEILL